MAMTADPEFHHQNLSRWAQVVQGESKATSASNHSPSSQPSSISSPVASVPERNISSECSPSQAPCFSSSSSPPLDISLSAEGGSDSNNNFAASSFKKPAWNKPSNGIIGVGPVMGAASWPALSESARGSQKSLADSSKDGLLSTSQVASSHQHPPPPPPFAVPQMPPSSFGNFVPAMPYPSTRDPQYRDNSWETRPIGGFASQSHKDHRHSSRRGGNYGPRGDGGYNNFWGRREQDRGNYGNARDGHMQPPRAPPRGFPRPSPPAVHSFVPPQPVRPFMNPIGYPEYMYFTMEPFRGMPSFTPATPPMFMPVPEPPVSALLLHQIDYYFSDDNLVKDDFLKSNMDDQGWVAISLIAGFPRVKSLTSNIQLIVDSLRSSTVVEVQDDKVRRRNDWRKWVPYQVSTVPGSLSPGGSSSEMLASSFQQITVREESTNQSGAGNVNPHAEDALGRHPSHLSNGDGSERTCLN
ncbi:la-related protein 1C isoform X3 [Gossypium raimondii]|uniref:HTH La-type RNA-binding domain-containing protein n=1 Tax=Gossypium raimondii TaxID=29730 RepID=A0A0D2Q4X2_GOSRA|nr:la-related protein 1C isoform X3 [Gossypium raimondii]KJB14374.1 hypothetical protein B456_002G121900 [Gossypium raimondii]